MGQSLKAIIQLFAIVAGIVAIVMWILPKPDSLIWSFRIITPVLAFTLGWVLWRNSHRKEILPDMLAQICGNYFERDGFCFGFVPTVVEGVCWMQIFFQNRYENPCHARVVLQPPMKSFSFSRIALTGIDADVECEGGAFGVCRVPWPIRADLQGKMVNCEIACRTSYPRGGGRLLRFREGMRAGSPSSGSARAAATAGLLLVGVVSITSPAKIQLRLPTGVAEQRLEVHGTVCEILWRPDLPTGGFAVITEPPLV